MSRFSQLNVIRADLVTKPNKVSHALLGLGSGHTQTWFSQLNRYQSLPVQVARNDDPAWSAPGAARKTVSRFSQLNASGAGEPARADLSRTVLPHRRLKAGINGPTYMKHTNPALRGVRFIWNQEFGELA